ncbi:hypothetical protein U9M48_029357 [Paspalum notatum var. saurae]|uniref:alanine--tRNA ligase n=1 Tax=Paspalum notatum var. saurae TaxID=547442 RepID=A0AAQ3X2M1_PASNO
MVVMQSAATVSNSCNMLANIKFFRTIPRNNTDPLNFLEIGKIILVKFDRDRDGVLKPLQFEHVLVGLNFECLVSVLQDKKSYYDTDICTPILTKIHAHAGKGIPTYHSAVGSNDGEVAIAYRVFCDYLRVIAVAAANHKQIGIHGREYLLKLMDRWAIQLGHQKLKIDGSSYFKLVSAAVEAMAVIIPELVPIKEELPQIAKGELDIYKNTLAEVIFVGLLVIVFMKSLTFDLVFLHCPFTILLEEINME